MTDVEVEDAAWTTALADAEALVLQAADACVGVTHGAITKTLVAHFVAGR